MNANSFARTASPLALQLSALTQRPLIVKTVPKAAANGRPLDVDAETPGAFGRLLKKEAAAKREKLLAAVAAFNAS